MWRRRGQTKGEKKDVKIKLRKVISDMESTNYLTAMKPPQPANRSIQGIQYRGRFK